ncbi:PREDICTED: serine/threonine-protein kinase prpf4B [Ipomoea nil]|uniref:serine/threonine-protein kinase prpf4B n=1 Tax=Ipomoea nil TaxID=35883 RepID=UPI0009011420|nr:PREDICTED: serine/threonine-protein kinase prpf4B [Ipomoea nil]
MASDSTDLSRRKHRRSSPSDDEAKDASKRRKHRHHHHHRHHRRSKKHEESDSKSENEIAEAGAEIENEKQALGSGAMGVVVGSSNLGIDYDMEEGEIVDDILPSAAAAVAHDDDDVDGTARTKELDLDRETEDELLQNHPLVKLSNSDMKLHEAQVDAPNPSLPSESNLEKSDRNSISSGGYNAKRKDREHDDDKIHKHVGREIMSSEGYHANGNSVGEYHKGDHRQRDGKRSPDKEDRKQKSYRGDENDFNQKNSLTTEDAGKRHKAGDGASPHDGYYKKGRSRKESKSPNLSGPSELDDKYYKDWKYKNDSDNERMTRRSRDYRHGSRDISREKGERSPSHGRYVSREERHHSRETIERYREASLEINRDRVRDKDKERARENYRVRERERERGRESEREKTRDREKEKDRDRHRDIDSDRERGRERRDKDRENRRGRNGDRERDRDSDRSSRCCGYDDLGSSYGDRDRYSASRHIRDDETRHSHRETSNNVEESNSDKKLVEMGNEKFRRDDDEQEEYQEKITMQLAEQEEDIESIKEESRRRRQAILEKYKNQQQQTHPKIHSEESDKGLVKQSAQPVQGVNLASEVDARTDDADTYVGDQEFSVGKSPHQDNLSVNEQTSGVGGLGQGSPKSERSNDMFCDDIFGESPAGVRKQGKGDGLAIERSGLNDNWDDAEGYYSYRLGEVLDGRYEIIAAHGKGVFSMVVRAKDLKAKPGDPQEVAIKMIRNNETMYKAGMEELVILKKLVGTDPEDRRHCVRFLSSFKYRNHLCLVFESLHMNLREVLKKFGRNIGLKLTAVRAYAKQLFIALKHLKNCGVLHCDIKPDNMLVNEAKNVLKLCDFGNAMFVGKNEITPYLVSRFYRSPEIILGLTYDHPMDMWSVGCCLYELYTGKVLFPGPTNNDMLRLHMELKGPFPKKMLRKGAFTDRHFDQDLNFLATEEDPVTKKAVRKLITNIKPKDIGTIVLGSPGEDPKMFTNFKDLLERIFMLDPDKRLTVSQALSHPFITGK